MTAPPIEACTTTTADHAGVRYVTFGGCNYLGLAQHPAVLAAAAEATARYGLSTSASRETTGNTRVHADLEEAVRAFCARPAALLTPDGYIANLAAMQGAAAVGVRHAVVDERAHASLKDAAAVAGMARSFFRHRDAADAARALSRCDGPAVVATDSVFAADGALAPAGALLAALRPGDRLLLDDCHGLGVLGRGGRGVADAAGLPARGVIVTATLAKGIGCAGGVVMGEPDLVDAARKGSTAYVCTTPCSPVLAAAALESIRVLEREPERHARLLANAAHLRSRLAGPFGVDPDGMPVVAFTAGTVEAMRRMRDAVFARGMLAPLVEYPGGPAPAYFRLSVTAEHTAEQIDLLADALVEAAELHTGAAS